MGLGVSICEHRAITLASGDAYLALPAGLATQYRPKMSGLRIRTGLANDVGGDQECSFTIDLDPTRQMFCGKGDLVLIYGTGVDWPVWAGRIAETTRIWGARPRAEVHAKGTWVQLTERLITGAIDWSSEYPNQHEVLAYALRELGNSGLVARDVDRIANFSVDLGTGGFNIPAYSQYLADVIRTVAAFGDDNSPPRPTQFGVGQWRENYLGQWSHHRYLTNFQPPDMGEAVAGSGSVDYNAAGGGVCRCVTSGAAADGAIVYDVEQIRRLTYQRDSVVRYMCKAKWEPTLANGMLLGMFERVAAPVCTSAAGLGPESLCFVVQRVDGNFRIIYYDDSDVAQYWDEGGGSWTTSATNAYAGSNGTYYTAVYEHNTTGFKLSLFDASGATKYCETDVVLWSSFSTKQTDRLWAWAGDPYNDLSQGVLSIQYFKGWRWTAGGQAALSSITLADWEYELTTSEIGDYSLTNPDESLANYVVASYGDPVAYTAVAQDADSQAEYGRRDVVVNATSIAPGAAALLLRDRKLEESKDEVWRGSPIQLKGRIRRKDGTRVPCWWVRAGDRVRVCNVNWPEGLTFVVGSTDYDDDAGTVSITPLDMPDTIETWITQLSIKTL